MRNSIIKNYIGKSILDIITVGSVDIESNPSDICTNNMLLYLEFPEGLLLFSSIVQMSELGITQEESIKFDYEIDEDDLYSKMSISNFILRDTISDVCIVKIIEYLVDGKLKAIEFNLKNNQMLFIDPTYYTGIKLGGEDIKSGFFENHDNVERIEITQLT